MGEVNWPCWNGVGVKGTHTFAKEKVKMLFSFLFCYLNRKVIAVTLDKHFTFSLWLSMIEKGLTNDVFGE